MGENDLNPLTDLGLALGASNRRIRTRSSIESGAGVNAAASRLNMTFVASDPLSELVWSPHKGLSLKYADFRFSDQRPRDFWDVGPSNVILSPSQRNPRSRTTNMSPIDEENITISQTREQTQFAKSRGGSTSLNPATDPSCSPQCGREYGSEVGLKLCSTSEPRQELLSNSTPLSGKDKANPENSTPMVNQEFTAESDLWTLKDKIGSGKKELSPPDTRNKGKEKALSVNNKMLQDENDSHDSVESSNSTGLLSKGKKKWIFEHQDIVESKRAKRDIYDIPASSSFPRQDSSFMNWISNVAKGLYKSDEADALPSSPPLSLINTNTRFGHYDQQIIVSAKDPKPEPESRIAGFQTMFQSIYCANPKDNEKSESNGDEEAYRSKELVQVDNSRLLKRKFTESTSEVGEAPFNSEKANINMISGTAHKSEPLVANFWISRFSHKAPNVLIPKLDHQGQRAGKELDCPPDQMKPIVDQLKLEQVVDNLGDSDDDKSVHHFSNTPSSPKVNSEDIASIFARRLVAIKHIIPLDAEIEESAVEINSNSRKQPIVNSPVLINPNLDWKISSEKRESSSDERQKLVSCSGDDVLEPMTKHANVPIGVFEFIKKLRLTRMDIFKWINSGKSLSKLNGYFTRVRLGKKEGEVGGGGGGNSYHVACISGEQKEGVEEGSKVSISVVVGGVRCWVESQYISNKGFLEDELMVWWFSTVKKSTVNNLIAKDNLQIKLEERQRLGI